jgi:cytochrome P450
VADDWIDGMKIPKGTIVFINAWGLHHDEKRFPDPERFDPDHFEGVTELAPDLAARVDPEERDHYGYGSGRRMCPGEFLVKLALRVQGPTDSRRHTSGGAQYVSRIRQAAMGIRVLT